MRSFRNKVKHIIIVTFIIIFLTSISKINSSDIDFIKTAKVSSQDNKEPITDLYLSDQDHDIYPVVDKKIPYEEIPLKTIKVTIHALRWIFLLVFLFLIIGTFILLATGGQQYFQMIVGFGITGFFTFFMGEAFFILLTKWF